jgi:hypothetical protein
MMVGKKLLKPLSALGYSRVFADAARILLTLVNCTTPIIEPLSGDDLDKSCAKAKPNFDK